MLMLAKFISLSAAIITLNLTVSSRLDATSPLYYFASNQLWVNLIMIILAGAAVAISFKRGRRFGSWYSYAGCLTAATLLILLGGLGVFYSNFLLDGWDLMLPLNFLMMLECGLVLAICGLSYKHARRPVRMAWATP